MLKYIVRRLLQAIPTLFGISILSYLLMLAAPGGPVAALTFAPNITPAERESLKETLGVNDPPLIQYLRWLVGDDWMRWDSDGDGVSDGSVLIPLMGTARDKKHKPILDDNGEVVLEPLPPGNRYGIFRGDFGRSFYQGRRQVLPILFERLGATLELGIASLLLGFAIGVPIGILAAVARGGAFDNFTRVTAVVFNALPVFWLGLLLILVFGSFLPPILLSLGIGDGSPILPMGSRCEAVLTGGCPPIYLRLEYLILPTFTIATGGIAGFSRYMRASMLDVISQDYMRTAHAKGLSINMVWFKHGARNALIPIATFLGPALTSVLTGAAITETIFAWPGIGRLIVSSVTKQDYPIVMATTMFVAILTILGFILSDIMYAVVDPRIRMN